MAILIIQENGTARTIPAVHGEEITIQTPCDCSAVTGVKIADDVFPFYDACGNKLAGVGDLFAADTLIRVLIDTNNQRAIIINRGVTRRNLGVDKVDNTADADKPISTVQAAAIADAKAAGTTAQTDITNHIKNKSNPHGVTAAQVGAAPSNHNHAISTITGLTDYVIANGTSGVWSYWKFNSGLCIAMGKPSVAWGTMTEVVSGQSRSVTALDLTGIFTAVMGGTCSNVHRYANCFVNPSGSTSAELWATTAVATSTMNVSNFSTTPMVVLFGKWK